MPSAANAGGVESPPNAANAPSHPRASEIGILSGFADPAVLGFHPVYLALAIGCGSKPIPWMNDVSLDRVLSLKK